METTVFKVKQISTTWIMFKVQTHQQATNNPKTKTK